MTNVKLNMLRKDVAAGTPTEFEFSEPCCDFLLKNMSDGDVYVSFGEVPASTDDMLLIPAGSWQRHICKEASGKLASCNTVYVIGTGGAGKGVEVECLTW